MEKPKQIEVISMIIVFTFKKYDRIEFEKCIIRSTEIFIEKIVENHLNGEL